MKSAAVITVIASEQQAVSTAEVTLLSVADHSRVLRITTTTPTMFRIDGPLSPP